ncbi:hypothetical protein [Pedobacter nototheniae]|uniref:hypothetical protein n=1 Tax=Pedobacter nototheniae TaxID=2488994 RepID=UPI00292FBF0A|nr:hypothetical protein [Pedobacter nototheniae]
MKNIWSFFSIFALAGIFFFTACKEKQTGYSRNYYAEAAILTPEFTNEAVNKHIKEFNALYNELAFAANQKEKGLLPNLNKSFSSWILKAVELKEKLPAEEQKKLNDYMEKANSAWNQQKDILLRP